MWPFSGKIRIRMERLWGGFSVLLVLYATKLDAASSSSVTSKSFASSVLPSISTSTLSPRIQSITSNTNGGFSTAEVSSKYGNNTTSSVQPAADATSSLLSSSVTKTDTSVLPVSGTRIYSSYSTTISSISSQSVDTSQTSNDGFFSTVSSNYSMNTSSLSSLNIKSSSTFILSDMRTSAVSSEQLQASEVSPSSERSPSLQQGNTSASTLYLTSVVSSAVNLSNVVSATRTFLAQSSSAIEKSIFSQSKLSHTLTVNGSSTGLPSPSIAGSSTPPLENSLMVSSSSVVVATNRTLATSPLTSSMLAKASTTATESLSTVGMSLTILSSRISKSAFNSSAHSLNATVTPTTVPVIETTISATYTEDLTPIPTLRSSSSVVNVTLQSSSFSSSTGLVVSQTRAVADSSAVLPSLSVPSRSVFSVSAVNTSSLLPSATDSLQTSPAPSLSSVSVGVKSSMSTALGEESSFMMSQNATSQSILATVSGSIGVSSSLVASKSATMQLSASVSLHSPTVTAPSGTFSPGVVSSLATASGKESIPLSSGVLLSSQLVLSVASSSSATGASLSLTATATGESSSSAPSVVSSRFVFSQNATSQSSSTGGFSLTSQMVTPSRPSVATVISPAASVTPNKTSIDEGFTVTSYSTPCYIYYVVEKTVFPVATANHSAALSTSTTPKITLDIATASRTQSGLPSVTLTHTIAMTTQVSETQSQVVGSTVALTSSTSLLGISANSGEITPYSTLKRVSSKASVVSSEAVTETMVTATNKAEQTDSVSVVSVTPSVSSSILGDRDVSTFQTGIHSTQVQSTTSLSGTLAIPPVTSSVFQLQSTSQKSKALVASTMMMSGSFTPLVASASVSEMQNVTTPFNTATSSSIIIQATTEHESLKSTPRSSSVMSQSSTQSTAFATTVAGSLPSQSVISTEAISSVSLVISSDSKPVNTQSSDGSILPAKSASIVQSIVSSSVKSVKQSQNSSVVQSSSMALVDSSASSAEMLSSTNIRASPSSSLVTAIPSTVVAKGSVVSTQVGSSREVASSSSPSIKDDKTDSTMMETLTSSGIYQSSHITPSVKQQESLVTPSQVGIASSLTSPSTQVAALTSFSQAENKTSASTTQSFSSAGISMPSSVSPSIQETNSSVVLSLSATPSKTSVIRVPASSSIHVTRSISFSQADSKSSVVEHLTSSSVSLESTSKKRAVGDTTSTGFSEGTVASASQSSSVVASIEPSSAMATYTHSPVLTSVLRSSGSLESASGFLSSQTVSASVSSPKGTASYSMPQGNSTSTVAISSGSPSTSSVSEPNLTVNTKGVSSAVVVATSSFHLSPSQQANVTTNHTEPVTRFSSSVTLNVDLTTSGTLTQSHSVLVSSSSNETSLTQAAETVKITTAHANLSVTNVVNTMTPSPTSVVLSTEGPSPSTLSLDIVTSSMLLGNSTSSLAQSVLSESSRVQSSSHGSGGITNSSSSSSTAQLSSPTTNQTSQAVLSSVLARPSPSAVQSSEIEQTVVSSSVTITSSSRVYRPPLVTISSLGICYVVYTTRIVQPSLVSTPVVNVSSTASVNVSSTRVSSVVTQPVATTVIQVSSASLNTSSVVVQPTLDFNATRSQFTQVLSTSLQVNVSLKASESSSYILSSGILSSTIPVVNSTTSLPAVASSTPIVKSAEVTQSLTVSSLRIQKSVSSIAVTTVPSVIETSLSTSTHLASTQVPTSQVISPTPTVSKEVSSSVTVAPTQPPDPSLLIEAIFKVPTDTDIQSEEFKTSLEGKLKDAYRFAKVSRRRKKRATPEVNATIVSIQRVNNEEDVNVTFFITQDDQGVPATEAAQNYQKLTKAQLGSFTNLEVVSSPKPLVAPTTPPLLANVLVSLLIQDSASNNVSIAGNKKKLEDNLAVYYKEQKNLTTTVTASITTILHEPNNIVYLEFYISVDDQAVNASVVVETFKVPNVNLLTAKLEFQILVQVYIPDSLTASEADYVIIGISVPESLDITDDVFRSDLADKLVKLYQKAKGQKNSRRKKRSGSTSVTIKDIVRKASSSASEADVSFFVYDAGKVSNASYVVSILNRLSTSDMTTVTSPYAVLSAPRQAFVPTVPTDVTPTVAATPIKYWIIAAVLGPIVLIILIILLILWRWKKGAPKSKVEPDTIRMLETDKRKPVHGFDVARYTEEGVSGMKTTTFMSRSSATINDDEEAAAIPVKRETSLRRKVPKRPIQKPPVREQRQANPAYEEEEEEEEDDESVVSVTPPRSTEALTRERIIAKPPSVPRKTPTKPERPAEPSGLDSEEDSEVSEGESESEPESVPPPEQTRHSAAQVPTVAVMSEASGPPRYPPVRFRSSVHPAPSLPPLDAKHTSLVGVKVEPPSEDDSTRGRRKGKPTKRELEQRADLERQKNKQRLRDRKRNASRSPGYAVPAERKAWYRAQYDFDDVLEEDDAERVITGKKRKPRRRRPPSSSLATDEEGVPHLKSYRKLKSPKTSSSISTRDRDKKRDKSESVSNASSDESEIDMNETRRRMHAMLDDAFSLFGPQFSKKYGKEPERQPEPHPPAHPKAHPEAHPEAQPEGYPATPARHAVIPRYIGGHPALPEPPPAHGRATEPTPRQRRRVQPTIPGYPVGMPQTAIGTPGYPGRPPVRPIVTRDPIVVWDPADRQRMLSQRAPPPTYSYKDPSGQNVYITPVQQQRDDMGGLVWSPYAAEDSMDALYPDLAQASYPGALGTSPPKDTSFLSHLQAAPPHDTVLNMSASSTFDQRGASLGQSPQPLIKSIKDELFRLSQGASRKTPITEL